MVEIDGFKPLFGGLQIKAQIRRHNDMVSGRRLQHDAIRQSKSVEGGMPRRATALDVDLLSFRQQIAEYTLDVSPNWFCDVDTQVEGLGQRIRHDNDAGGPGQKAAEKIEVPFRVLTQPYVRCDMTR